jgi:dihydrodipicolinate reductase
MGVLKLVVTGAAGRMGQALIRAIAAKGDMTLHAAVLHASW